MRIAKSPFDAFSKVAVTFEQGQVTDGGQMLMQELIVRCVHTDRTPGLPEQVENGFGQFHLVQVDRTTV